MAYWGRSLLGSAAVLLSTALLSLALIATRESNRDLGYLLGTAHILAQGIATNLGQVRDLLESMETDGVLQDALRSARPEALRAAELGLQKRLPGADKARLFTTNQISSVDGIPFASYAGLDLAHQAAQGRGVTPVEVHKVGQPEMHLAIAGPVFGPRREQILGVVNLALPLSLLPRPDDSLANLGTLEYRQIVGGQPVPLGGIAHEPESKPNRLVEIPGTRIVIAVWIAPRGPLDPQLLASAAAVFAITLAAIGILLWLNFRKLRRALSADARGIVLLVQDALHRRPVRRPDSHLAETQRVHLDLMVQLRSLRSTTDELRGPKAPRPLPHRAKSEGQPYVPDSAPPQSEPVPEPTRRPEGNEATELDELDELDLPDPFAAAPTSEAAPEETARGSVQVPKAIFRAYDIRGVVDTQLTTDTVEAIGRAIGSAAMAGGDGTVMLGRDCRASSPALSATLAAGIRSAGPEVVDLGIVPTPLVYFACCYPARHAGAVVTGSHNPPAYNGIKPVLDGRSATSEEIQALRRRIETGDLSAGSGGHRRLDRIPEYQDYIAHDIALARNLRVAIDCGNATTSAVAPDLYRSLGCEVIERHCDLCAGTDDAIPDPAIPEYLLPLGELVVAEHADVGLAFDGDGDRLGVVDCLGQFIPADRVLMLLAADVLSRHPGTDVVFDVKCSSHVAEEVRRAGGRPVMWRSGHTPLKAKLRECGALIAGELSGHIIFQERWFGFDDAVYAGARLLEVLSLDPRPSEEIFAALPGGVVTPELTLPLEEGEPARLMDSVIRHAGELEGAELILLDGVRAEFDSGWGLVRASNTQPMLTFRFEGADKIALEGIQSRFRQLLDRAAPGLALPF